MAERIMKKKINLFLFYTPKLLVCVCCAFSGPEMNCFGLSRSGLTPDEEEILFVKREIIS